jgi:hypothetical protein
MGFALAAFLALQDPDALIRALGDDAVRKREAAHAALVHLGPAALPKVEAALATSDDPEVKARLRRIREQIRTNEKVRAAVGPTARVTLKVEGAALGDVLDRINAQGAGDQASCEPALRDRRVKLEAAGLPYFEALQAICVQNDGIYLDVGEPLLVRAGACVPAATACSGPFVIQAIQLKTTRSINGRGREDLEVRLAVKSQANVRPLAAEVTLDGFIPAVNDGHFGPDTEPGAWSRSHRFERRGAIADDLESVDLKGQAAFWFAVDRTPRLLEIPDAVNDRSEVSLDDERFVLSVQRRPTQFFVELGFTGGAGDEDEVERTWDLFLRVFTHSTIQFQGSDGNPVDLKSGGRASSGDRERTQGWSQTLIYHIDGNSPARVRVTLPQSIHREIVPFQMKGLRLR